MSRLLDAIANDPGASFALIAAGLLFLYVIALSVWDWLASPVEPADNLIDFRRRDKPETIADGWSNSEGNGLLR